MSNLAPMLGSFLKQIREFRAKIAKMQESHIEDCLATANDGIAMVKLRIQTSGLDKNSSPFAPYTSPYAKWRQNKGYQVGYVDFTVTGRLWANVRPFISSQVPGAITIQVKASNAGDQKKIDGAFKKRGNILLNTPDEERILTLTHAQRRAKRMKE